MHRFLLAFLLGTSAFGEPAAEFGAHRYIEYQPGTLPLIIGAPHGGSLKPDDITTRNYGVVDQDANTQEMARELRAALLKKTGAAPYLVICRLHRAKLDCNRELTEAAQGDHTAELAWQEWQGFIGKAKTSLRQQFNAGLYIDLHGQRHKEGRVELGYMIAPQMLRQSDTMLNQASLVIQASSIRELDQRSPTSFIELLRGPTSLGGMLQQRGYKAVPSPAIPAPQEGELYFRGGYNTDTHGSRKSGTISAVQIECPFDGVRDTAANRAKFINDFCDLLPVWFQTHFGAPLAARSPTNP